MNALSIYRVLITQEFDDWYKGAFDDHVKCVEGSPEQLEILKDIEQLFDVDS